MMPVDVTPGAALHTSAVCTREKCCYCRAYSTLGVDVVDAVQATTPQLEHVMRPSQ